MIVTDAELATLAGSHDIITLGMHADETRRRLHGAKTTFVRVTRVAAEVGAAVPPTPLAGEVRIEGTPASRAAGIERVEVGRGASGSIPLSAYSLSDLEQLSAREHITLRALLEDLAA